MLKNYGGGTIAYIPHKLTHRFLLKNLGENFDNIINDINEVIDNGNSSSLEVSSWLGSRPWEENSFIEISNLCGGDEDRSGECFGLMVWIAIQQRKDCWYPYRGLRVNGVDIRGMAYFNNGNE